jgi:AcrR family transcriptional regulator
MAKRGDQLREHILWVAKAVFLEMGFERASMDVVAGRAQTSKRSVYTHFASKEKLFLAVIELVRGLFLAELKMPEDYAPKPADALVLFCGRYLEILIFEGSIRMMRVSISMAESGHFQAQVAAYYDVLFTQVHGRLSGYLKTAFGISGRASAEAANRLMGQVHYPRLQRALFGLDVPAPEFGKEGVAPDFDLKPIRKAVVECLESLKG